MKNKEKGFIMNSICFLEKKCNKMYFKKNTLKYIISIMISLMISLAMSYLISHGLI